MRHVGAQQLERKLDALVSVALLVVLVKVLQVGHAALSTFGNLAADVVV